MPERSKAIGIIALLAAFIIGALNSILITNPSILDTDSSTYIIVVMLMLPLLIIFSGKEELMLTKGYKGTVSGIFFFAFYIALMIIARGAMSFAFFSYRVDAFIMPIFIMSIVAPIFGIEGIKRLKMLIVYAFFASPLLLLPLFKLNNVWANANTSFVFVLLKSLGYNISKIGQTIHAGAGAFITISSTCVSLGTFVALIMFLIPLAYFYKGDIKNTVVWLICGFLLMLLLNILRIIAIMLSWLYSGLSGSVLVFHTFAGQILFYIAIVVMFIIAPKFNLHIERIKRSKPKKPAKREMPLHGIFIALVFGIISLLLTIPYASAISAPAELFDSANASQNATIVNIIKSLENAHMNIYQLGLTNKTTLYAIKSASNSTIYLFVYLYKIPEGGTITANYSGISAMYTQLLPNGISLKSARVVSMNSTFIVNYFSAPYLLNGSYITENYLFFAPLSNNISFCNANGGPINNLETAIYNLGANSEGRFMCASYDVAKGIK